MRENLIITCSKTTTTADHFLYRTVCIHHKWYTELKTYIVEETYFARGRQVSKKYSIVVNLYGRSDLRGSFAIVYASARGDVLV